MAYPGTPPQGLGVTSCTMTDTTPNFRVVLEWTNPMVYSVLELQEKIGGGAWSTVDNMIVGADEVYVYDGVSYDGGTYFRIRGNIEGEGWTNWSNTAYKAIWFSSVENTQYVGELMADASEVPGESNISDTATARDTVTDTISVLEIISDTVTASDSVRDVSLEKLVLGRFLGTNNGKLYLMDSAVHGDGGVAIPSWWESKDIDMDDQYQQFIGKYKYLHGIKLRYVDVDEVTMTLSVSTDGGGTWVANTKTFGTGSGTPKEKIFNFWIHGRTFMVRVFHTSADKDFQCADLELMFEPAGDYFEV